jgi:hypothetical protein
MELSKSIQMFYKTIVESSSDEESDDDTELMMATTILLHEHILTPMYRGSVKIRKPNVKRNPRNAATNSIATTSILPTQSLMRQNSGATTGCQGSCT